MIETITAANLTDFSFALAGNSGVPDRRVREACRRRDAADRDRRRYRVVAHDDAAVRRDAGLSDGVGPERGLLENAQGYAVEHMDVAAEFQFMFSGLDFTGPNGIDPLDIGDLVPGNRIYVDVHSQNWRIVADESLPTALTRIGSVSVSATAGGDRGRVTSGDRGGHGQYRLGRRPVLPLRGLLMAGAGQVARGWDLDRIIRNYEQRINTLEKLVRGGKFSTFGDDTPRWRSASGGGRDDPRRRRSRTGARPWRTGPGPGLWVTCFRVVPDGAR